jgi:hypothetical protein
MTEIRDPRGPFHVWLDGHTMVSLSEQHHREINENTKIAGESGIPSFIKQYSTAVPPQYGRRYIINPNGTAVVEREPIKQLVDVLTAERPHDRDRITKIVQAWVKDHVQVVEAQVTVSRQVAMGDERPALLRRMLEPVWQDIGRGSAAFGDVHHQDDADGNTILHGRLYVLITDRKTFGAPRPAPARHPQAECVHCLGGVEDPHAFKQYNPKG